MTALLLNHGSEPEEIPLKDVAFVPVEKMYITSFGRVIVSEEENGNRPIIIISREKKRGE